jgi:HAD superfamily hydrolase (TIGR01662 family)
VDLYLPEVAWLLRPTDEVHTFYCNRDEDLPFFRHSLFGHHLDVEGHLRPELLLDGSFDPESVRGEPHVLGGRQVWLLDRAHLPRAEDGDGGEVQMTGQYFDQCMGRGYVYETYDAALGDLAKCSKPIGRLWGLAQAGGVPGGLARAVLDGDLGVLLVLADALGEAGDPLADAVRRLGGEAKRKKRKAKAAPPPPPRPPVDLEMDEARRRAAAPCPGCGKADARRPYRVFLDGPDRGRLFLMCRECSRRDWLGAAPTTPGHRSRKRSASAAPAEAAAAPAKKHTGQEVVLIGGMPAGGKSTLAADYVQQGCQRLNRDALGGSVDGLLPRLGELLAAGESVVLDNLYATRDSRAGAVKLAKEKGVPVRFVLLDASLEDAQFNACLRMVERCGRVLHPEDHKQRPYRDDPNLFPVAVLYKYRKEFQAPTAAEGFAAVDKVKFERRYPADWTKKAVIFDFDGTLRGHEGKEKYPVHPREVRALTARAAKVRQYEKQGYLLLGASNQSGVAKGLLTAADAEACFAETLRQLGLTFHEVRYCPHKVPPISCYCRKPGPGMGVELIAKYKLDPRQCIYVGDLGTDASFAARCGFRFVDHNEFFKA